MTVVDDWFGWPSCTLPVRSRFCRGARRCTVWSMAAIDLKMPVIAVRTSDAEFASSFVHAGFRLGAFDEGQQGITSLEQNADFAQVRLNKKLPLILASTPDDFMAGSQIQARVFESALAFPRSSSSSKSSSNWSPFTSRLYTYQRADLAFRGSAISPLTLISVSSGPSD